MASSSESSGGSSPRERVGFMFGNTTNKLRLEKNEGRKLFDEVIRPPHPRPTTDHAYPTPPPNPIHFTHVSPFVAQDALEALDTLGDNAGDVDSDLPDVKVSQLSATSSWFVSVQPCLCAQC